MASLADVERLLERVFERSTARLFRTRIQAVQVERRVERAMERARASHGGRTSVPSRYRVRMEPTDLREAASREGSADILAARLADAALAFARQHGYHLAGRPMVSLIVDPSLAMGQVEVDAVADRTPSAGVPSHRAASGSPPPVSDGPSVAPQPAKPAPEPPRAVADPSPIRGDGTQTAVFRRPPAPAAHAVLRELDPEGRERRIEVDGSVLTIGRARDNGLVIDGARVSRHHGRLQARRGALVYTDLSSTNGSRVNGIAVDEIVLGAGDRLQIGDSVLVVETLPG